MNEEETAAFQRALVKAVDAVHEDRQDRRCLRGKYAPAPGVCRVCSGQVLAEISFPNSDRIGGPPQQGYVSGWYCEECQLIYRARPKDIAK